MNFGIKVKISITEALNEATLSVLDGNLLLDASEYRSVVGVL